MRTIYLILVAILVAGCLPALPEYDPSVEKYDLPPADADGDGYESDVDCDDDDASIYPGAEEICDGQDNDCDELTDEDVAQSFYLDSDGDSYGDPNMIIQACEASSDYVDNADDCDDDDQDTYPGAPERCDGDDNDCDEQIDEDLVETWYLDSDGDSFGNVEESIESCDPSSAYVANPDDCDDADAEVYPEADEYCDLIDNDCDSMVDEDDALDAQTWYFDEDGDGYGLDDESIQSCQWPEGYARHSGDCDDGDIAFNPAALEDDCTDPNDYNCDGSTGYADDDSDGFAACEECNDSDASINPAATEICDELDNDCDGLIDDEDDSLDASTGSIFYLDGDGDGYGDSSVADDACEPLSGYVADATDCDDTDADINPDATEVCDEDDVDEDCNGYADDDDVSVDVSTQTDWFDDGDGDSYGDAASLVTACESPDAHAVTNDSDCDDTDSTINPDATEVCDEDDVDEDCDGLIDDDDPSVDVSTGPTFYLDWDGDGYGADDYTVTACDAPSGYVEDSTDCDDADVDVSPAATDEQATAWDEDCDGDDGRADGYEYVTSYYGNWYASGSSLVEESTSNEFSTLESGITSWYDVAGSSLVVSTHVFSSVYSGEMDVIEFPENTGTHPLDGCVRADDLSTSLSAGVDYGFVFVVANTSTTGSTTIFVAEGDGYEYHVSGEGDYIMGALALNAGDEVLVGEAFTASDSSEDLLICALGNSGADEMDLRISHFGIYSVN
ncbi:hypothetical protein HN358_02540 [Candidatus Uhrbacteria bacterium]|nr:hypothetical protein [Candidatus Uhrbacteria bacterium]MBT7717558.1 hypothetical protein [Candidatus Uhrbacteria bacterium]